MHKVSKEALIWAAIFAVALIVFGLLYAPTWWLRLLTRIPTGPQRSLLSISRRVPGIRRARWSAGLLLCRQGFDVSWHTAC